MARTATLYRIALELSDVDRGVYETLDLRVAQHPSEDETRLVTRILARALLHEEGLEFGRGLSTTDEPALWTHDLTGQLTHWIDVGTPTGDRIHTASKRAKVTIVCHKGPEALERSLGAKAIHRAEAVDVIHLDPTFVATVAEHLERKGEWTLVRTDGELSLTIGAETFAGQALAVPLG